MKEIITRILNLNQFKESLFLGLKSLAYEQKEALQIDAINL